jgi:hypothetical protein
MTQQPEPAHSESNHPAPLRRTVCGLPVSLEPLTWMTRRLGRLTDAVESLWDAASRPSSHARSRRRRQSSLPSAAAQILEVRCLPATLPVISIAGTTVTEGDSGTTNATLVVSLNQPSAVNVRVNYATRAATAFAGSDFTSQAGTVTIPAGQTTASISVLVKGDTTYEATESFDVVLSRPIYLTLGQAIGNVVLQNDDALPSLSINDATVNEASSAAILLSLTNPSSTPITIVLAGVSGSALSGIDFPALNRTIVIPAGRTSYPVRVPTRHDVLDEPLEAFSVEITSIAGATLADGTSVVSIHDNDPPALTISDVVISESAPPMAPVSGNGPASAGAYQAVITMSSASTVPVTVKVYSRDKTAVSGRDFTRVAATIVIPAGETSAVANLSSVDDQLHDPNESFELFLSSPINATLARPVSKVSITDNDPDPVLTAANTTVTEGNSGELLATVRVDMSPASSLPVTFQYRTMNSTALAGFDYIAAIGTMTIPAGSMSRTFTVRIKSDLTDEDAESIRIILSNVVNASINPEQGVITIEDNDAAPRMTISHSEIAEGDTANVATQFTVTLSAASERAIQVNYHTEDHLAVAGRDYFATSGTLTIPPGQTTGVISLTSVADTIDEPSRAFRLTFSNPVHVTLSSTMAVVTVTDDDGTALPLFAQSDMAYLGGFRVPTGQQGSSTFDFGGNGLAFNPANNSLFIGSHHDNGLNIAEIGVPSQLSSTGALSLMPSAAVLQPFMNLGGLTTTNAAGQSTAATFNYENLSLGGLLVSNGGLTGGMYMGYNGAEPQFSSNSHFRTSSLNLASLNSTNFAGLLDIRQNSSGLSGRVRGGYMAEVPVPWQDYIGASFVTGAAGLNRVEFSSAGPALFGFDANNPAGSSGDPLVCYPINEALQWSSQFIAQPLFNGTTKIEGVAFVPGTRSVIFIGSNGLSEIGYGVGSKFNDKARPYSGFHSKNGNYKYQIWSYDIDGFMAVRNGSKTSSSIRPTTVINFDLPTPEPSKYIGGTAFDPATGRLFISQKLAGPDATPVIHVYQLGRS